MKGVCLIYQQTFIDTYSRHSIFKPYGKKTQLAAADLLIDRALPFYESEIIPLLRILTDRGTEFCGNPERHSYELYPAISDIDHTRTKAGSPQTCGIRERFHNTVLGEFYRIAFRKKIYHTVEELQKDLDERLYEYNYNKPHQGKRCEESTPYETMTEGKAIAIEKMIAD